MLRRYLLLHSGIFKPIGNPHDPSTHKPHPLLAKAEKTPLIAILRGLLPEHAQAVGAALYQAGFRALEVPLNRPGAIECIGIMVRTLPADALVGGGVMWVSNGFENT